VSSAQGCMLRLALTTVALVACLVAPLAAGETLRLATTTSTEQSGLLQELLPAFEAAHGCKVHVIAVGSGKALKLGENGDVDVILSHAPGLERAFMEAGFDAQRRAVMYNDFVVVGPPDDPAGVRAARGVAEAFRRLAAAQAAFVSRGDESGTHQKEKEIWQAADTVPGGSWYLSAGLGMGEVLRMAGEKRAYTLADRGTFAVYPASGGLAIVHQGDPLLRNPYAVITVNPARHPEVKAALAEGFARWLTSADGQRRIAAFLRGGRQLFHPAAVETAAP